MEFFRDAKIVIGKFVDKFFDRDILLEATSSQKFCEKMVCSGDQGSDQGHHLKRPTLSQCYWVGNEIEIFQISYKNNLNYALNHWGNRLQYNYKNV